MEYLTDADKIASLERIFGKGSKEVNLLSDINAETIKSAFTQMDTDGNNQISTTEWPHFLEVIKRLSDDQRERIDKLMIRKEVTRATWLLKAKLGSLEWDNGGGSDADGEGGKGGGEQKPMLLQLLP